MQCKSCQNYDICQDCVSNHFATIKVEHPGCPKPPEMIFFDPESKGEEWIDEQVGLADAYIAQKKAEDEERQRAEEQAERCVQEKKHCDALQRQQELKKAAAHRPSASPAPPQQPLHKIHRPSPSPARPAAKRPVPRRKGSSSLGTALLNFGTAVVKAEMQQVSLASGGGGGYAANGAMDMSSFWAPIQSAASF
jgi:hypothetical protein